MFKRPFTRDNRASPSAKILLFYALPAVPLAALVLPVQVFLPAFYADKVGLALGAVGLAFLAARLWDVFTDPIVGALSDRLPTRWGRRKPWVLVGLPLVMVSVHRLFIPDPTAGFAYLVGWTFVLYLGWTLVVLPLTALGAELSDNYNGRSRVVAIREAGVIVGTLVAAGMPAILAATGRPDQADALSALAWWIVVALPITVACLMLFVPEPAASVAAKQRWSGLFSVLRTGVFRRLIVAYLLNGIANGLPASLFILFVSHTLGIPDQVGVLLFIYFVSAVVAIPLWLRVSYRFGKHRAWIASMVLACIFFPAAAFLSVGDFWPFVLICILTGLSLGADLAFPSAILADVVDADHLRGGRAQAGSVFAWSSLTTKLALAIAVGVAFPALEWLGFSTDGGNTSGALFSLAAFYCLAPIPFKVAAVAIMWNFPIDERRHAEIRDELARQGSVA